MLISYNALAYYVNLDGVSLEELCKEITKAGIEVEAVTPLNAVPEGVVAAEIRERKPHPNADKLSVCRVFNGSEEVQIVCGAPNCDAGKIVPLAVIGTKFHENGETFEIKKAKLRGVESFGMMCSAKEIGVGDDHDGLLELPAETKPGTPVASLFKPDWQIEVEVTPNRPDWLSFWGIARDVSCLFDAVAKLPELAVPKAKPEALPENLVTVNAPDLCLRYTAQVVRNVTVKESPEWLKRTLRSVGLRPINNIVDITNFIMMELGQPLHAFDYDKLAEGRIVVRRAADGEKLELLNGKTVELGEKNLVICDAARPLALAGIMGGEESGISERTVSVLIESAVFAPSNIRATSRALGVSSDSSYRFERGIDFEMADYAGKRAVQLICELAGGQPVGNHVDVYSKYPARNVIGCRFDKIRKLLGMAVTNQEITAIFRKLHLEVADETESSCVVTAPLFRMDLEREADLAEEVARIRGLDAIPLIPVNTKIVSSLKDDARLADSTLRDQWIGLGLIECMNYSTVTAESALSDTRFKESDLIRISNPISPELAWVRPSLWGEMIQVAARNIARRNLDWALFEQDRVFCGNPALFPEERQEICLMLSGAKQPELYGAPDCDFYDLKGLIETLLNLRGTIDFSFEPSDDRRFVPGTAAKLLIDGREAGQLGRIPTDGWRTPHAVFGATIEAAAILGAKTKSINAVPLPNFPATARDVAFLAPSALTHAEITAFIRGLKLANFESVELFDVFSDEKVLGAGKKSMAYRVTFRNMERTLKDEEVNQVFDKLRKQLADKLGVELR
ncbi:MAG: phenylalanine--tRNA ligase subunit beta [Victivallaceae bacterium]|nr:phenylalanine--tRNA ligase subunit beta [Victivallaceae bacterium]